MLTRQDNVAYLVLAENQYKHGSLQLRIQIINNHYHIIAYGKPECKGFRCSLASSRGPGFVSVSVEYIYPLSASLPRSVKQGKIQLHGGPRPRQGLTLVSLTPQVDMQVRSSGAPVATL